MSRTATLSLALLMASTGPAAAVTAFAQWVGGPGVWADPLRWAILCPAQIPPPMTPGNTTSCLFTVNAAGTGSDVQADLPATISVLNLTAGATLSVNLGLTSVVSTTVGSGSELSVAPVAPYVTGAYLNDGLLELDPGATLTAVSLVNTDRVESTGGTFTLGSLVNDGGATFEVKAGLTTLSTTLAENDGLFDLTASGASLTGSLAALEFNGSGEAVLGDDTANLTALGNLGNLGSHTIRGYGNLVSATTLNQGEILADAPGQTLSLVTGAFDNDGDLSAPGGTVDIDAASMAHDGTLEATGATGKWEIDAADVDNDATMEASQGGRGEIKNADLDNAGGTVSAVDGSVAFEETNIDGGQLTSGGTGFMTMAGQGLLQELTVDADLTLLPGSVTFVSGTIFNQQRITLSDGAGAPGAGPFSLLDGVGTLELTGDSATLGSTIRGWTNETQHTIEGFGLFQTLGLANNGLIRANQAGERLRITPAAQVQNRGTLQATGGGRLSLEQANVDNEGGAVEAQAGSRVELEGTTLRGGQLTGAGELRWSGLGNAILPEPAGGAAATSDVDQRLLGGAQLFLDDLVNDASVAVEGGAFLLSAGGQSLWTGSGDFVLETPTSTLGAAAVTAFTQGPDHTIRGQGLIQGFGGYNQGTMRADQAGQTLEIAMSNGVPATDIENDGMLLATNMGTLRIHQTDIDNTLGTIAAEAGSTVAMVDAEIVGGQLTGGGELTWEGTTNALREPPSGPTTQSDVDQRVLSGAYLALQDLVNEASVVVEGGGFLLSAGGQEQWTGSGEFVLESATSTLGSALVTQFTNGPTHTIRGQGLIQGFGAHNQGTMRADQAGQTLEITMSNSVPATDIRNDGMLLATNMGTLRIHQTDIDNTLGTIAAEAGSTVAMVNAEIVGGQLTGGGELTWEGTTNALRKPASGPATQSDVDQRVLGGAYLALQDLVNEASVVVEGGAFLLSAGGQELWTGSGEFVLESATSTLGSALVTQFTNGPTHTIRGQGLIQGFGAYNQGTILADQTGETLEIEMSNSVPSADVFNEGLLLATNGAKLRISHTDVDNLLGEIRADAGTVVELDHAILRGGMVTGGGEFLWPTSGTLGDPGGGTTQTDSLHRITGDYLGLLDAVGMESTVVNDGRIVVEAGGLFAPNSSLDLHLLEGSGSLELRDATSEVGGIIAGAWTQGSGHRLEGFGVIKAGAFGNNGILAPGLREAGQEIGMLDLVIVSTDLGVDSVLEIELAGTTQGSEYDFVSSSTLDLGGVLDARFHGSFETQILPTDVFTVLTSTVPLTGTFGNAANGARMTTGDGFGSFLVHYGSGSLYDPNSVVLSDYESFPDFGDAPDSYKTLLASDGPRHNGAGALRLGAAWDAEPDGQPSGGATGDSPDEDGVVFMSDIELDADSVGATQIDITASGSARLDAWIDFNADGDWSDPGERIFTNRMLAAGLNLESFMVMNAEVVPGETFARFRLSSAGGLAPTGPAADGEVEDYVVNIKPVDDLDLMNRLEHSTRTFWACNSILTGLPEDPFGVLTGAQITLHTGNFVAMRSDSLVEEDALLTVRTGSVPGCP